MMAPMASSMAEIMAAMMRRSHGRSSEALGVFFGRVHRVVWRVEGGVEEEWLAGGTLFGDHGS